ncbi:MAG TPA: RNA polymerase factor sigma-54 [Xanthobacteraceae bacterium]|nr:RNA polymerase factor sigma-54 [Xanthobacteraceae bacterium]
MALTQRLELRQGQALVMTPQLMQAIKLLQLSSLDLAAYVEGELERNPLLERASEAGEPGEEPAGEPDAGPPAADGDAPGDWFGDNVEMSRAAVAERLDMDLENVFPREATEPAPPSEDVPAASEWAKVGRGGSDSEGRGIEAFAAAEKTLAQHLSEQLACAVKDPARRLIGTHLIDLVDDSGYIAGDLGQVAEKLGTTRENVEAVLAQLQTFEPTGVCARNLAECLAIQLRERDRFDPAMQALVANLDLLAKRDFASLRKLCGVDDEDLRDMIAEIRKLDPKPGLAFGSVAVQPVVPDIFVRRGPDGGWAVELNSDTLPKVLVNQSYYEKVVRGVRGSAEKAYLSECMQNATWIVRALDQRARTILKVASEIVRQQDAFFACGVEYLRPLNLRAIADAIGMHESTVSRVTSNKFMATNRGIFELKYFFTSAIAATDGGDAHSAEAVRHRIRQLIDAESPDDVLSDDSIVEKLRASGIDIARRTVAKYREAMRIPSSVQRRREKLTALARSA